jgi:RNA polymerase sigma-70 factor (ECF subfamily)
MNNTWEENNLQALSAGGEKAFELLFLRYQPKLVYFLRGFIKDTELARDMAQDIFLSVWSNKEKFDQIHSFKAYLFKMGRNAICNYYDHSLVDEKFKSEQLFRPVDIDNIEEVVYANQLQGLIDITVSRMPPQRKLIYTMSRVEGVPNNEIAEKLNLNKRTIENHLTAALSDIRKIIKISQIQVTNSTNQTADANSISDGI